MTRRRHDDRHAALGKSSHWCLISTVETLKARCVECGDCWEWQASLIDGRCPVMRHKGQSTSARRVMYELSGRPLRKGHVVVTSCGNPRCLNPAHLKQLTKQQLAQQCGDRGLMSSPAHSARIAQVKQATSGKITTADARQIRASAEPVATLPARYGLSKDRVYRIRRGEAWREYTNPFQGLMAR